MNDVAVLVSPGDFLVAQLHLLKVVMLLINGILDVVHDRINLHHLHVLKLRIEVLHLLTGVIDFVPLKFSRLQGLPGGHGLVKVRAGRINFLGKQERRVNTGTGQLSEIPDDEARHPADG